VGPLEVSPGGGPTEGSRGRKPMEGSSGGVPSRVDLERVHLGVPRGVPNRGLVEGVP
jgi:hypothetical protein